MAFARQGEEHLRANILSESDARMGRSPDHAAMKSPEATMRSIQRVAIMAESIYRKEMSPDCYRLSENIPKTKTLTIRQISRFNGVESVCIDCSAVGSSYCNASLKAR
ncbi:MAG: hypothetical protein FJ267_00620 [Planctomycetes bacterium]|nr:hypothetical protein [Planctomycetota bacterium]